MSELRICDICGEESLINGCCYDCAVSCEACGLEPAHPNNPICDKCVGFTIDDEIGEE